MSFALAAITEVASLSAGPPFGGLYLKPPSRGGLWLGRDADAVGELAGALAVGLEDGVRDRRGRGVAVGGIQHHGDVVGGEHLQRGRRGRAGQRVAVGADEQRPVGALLGAVLADGLGDGQDVVPVEGGVQARPAVPGGAEDDPLVGDGDVGMQVLVGRENGVDVDEIAGLSRLSCAWIHGRH